MSESPDGIHDRTGIPIVSLYAEQRRPSREAFRDLDALLIDLQDVGTRVYTFLATALEAVRVAAAQGVVTFVLDRPNPIGGAVEGPRLAAGFASFVGPCDVPLRHGLTAGEFCRYGAALSGVASAAEAVKVVALEGWQRTQYFDESDLPWTMPSPNMPRLETAIVYPGMVAFEGTAASEGRGTTRPFELFGAPWLDPVRVLQELAQIGYVDLPCAGIGRGRAGTPLAGALLREVTFEPTFQKHAGVAVRGFQLHPLARPLFCPVATATALLWAIRRVHPAEFTWREPPYEYEWTRRPIDLIFGTDRVRRALEEGRDPESIVTEWQAPIADYIERVTPGLIYGPLGGGTTGPGPV